MRDVEFFYSFKAFFDEATIELYIKPIEPKIDKYTLEFAKVIEEHYGFKPPITIALGGDDGRFFRDSSVIVWGVEGYGTHTENEKVDKEDLVKTYNVFKDFIKRFA